MIEQIQDLIKEDFIRSVLEALMVGDSFGKATEFASRSAIKAHFSSIDKLLEPKDSLAHKDMRYAQVTDDTEQNSYLIEDYTFYNKINYDIAAKSILRWYEESPEPEKYIGPSTKRALNAIKSGIPVIVAGQMGTSCGGIMRVPSVFLLSNSLSELQYNIIQTLIPTHNTSAAMEAAIGYGYVLFYMLNTKNMEQLVEAAIKGCEAGRNSITQEMDLACIPSCSCRIQHLVKEMKRFNNSDELLDFLFYVYGTTISSCDVFVASFALFLWAKDDVFEAIKLATMLGGDTDTIACLAAVLCTVYARGHNIPMDIIEDVKNANEISITKLVEKIIIFRKA